MPHGLPDWGLIANKETVYGLDDLAELAVRLGSPVFFDRRGDVLYWTDFRDGLGGWNGAGSGLGEDWGLATGPQRSAGLCLRLKAGGTSSEYSYAYRNFGYPVKSIMGLEFGFSLPSTTYQFRVRIDWWDGTNNNIVWFLYDHSATTLSYYDSAGAWQDLDDALELAELDEVTHTMKLVWDMTEEEYVRLLLDDTSYSMAGIAIYQSSDPTIRQLRIRLWNQGSGGNAPTIYLDNIILTQNEPA